MKDDSVNEIMRQLDRIYLRTAQVEEFLIRSLQMADDRSRRLEVELVAERRRLQDMKAEADARLQQLRSAERIALQRYDEREQALERIYRAIGDVYHDEPGVNPCTVEAAEHDIHVLKERLTEVRRHVAHEMTNGTHWAKMAGDCRAEARMQEAKHRRLACLADAVGKFLEQPAGDRSMLQQAYDTYVQREQDEQDARQSAGSDHDGGRVTRDNGEVHADDTKHSSRTGGIG